ncbi:UNVERIFIED_CONTAM: hypothetical protein FKN15_059412 [Acipenser sinensis]
MVTCDKKPAALGTRGVQTLPNIIVSLRPPEWYRWPDFGVLVHGLTSCNVWNVRGIKLPGRNVYAQMHNVKEQEMTSPVNHSEDTQNIIQGEEFIDDDLDSQTLDNAGVQWFSTYGSIHCPLWFSLLEVRHPLGIGALARKWLKALLYSLPLLLLLLLCLEKIRQEQAWVLMLALIWPRTAWFSAVVLVLDGQPWELPAHRDLLNQTQGTLWDPDPASLQLWVWPLTGCN